MPLALIDISPNMLRNLNSYYQQNLLQSSSTHTARQCIPAPAWGSSSSSWCEAPTLEHVRLAISTVPELARACDVHRFLIDSPSKRRENALAHSSLFTGTLPYGAFLQVNNALCIPSVELCFVRFASCHTLVETVVFGFELCGGYRIDSANTAGMVDALPLTTPEKLIEFANQLQGMKGKSEALRAAKHVIANSKSPKESATAILLCFPRSLGGYSLEKPLLNHPLPNTQGLSCDALWARIKLAVEYESNRWHTGRYRITKDSKRRAVLMSAGIEVVTLTYDQLVDVNGFDLVASSVAKRLGVRTRASEPNRVHKRMELRGQLLTQGCL